MEAQVTPDQDVLKKEKMMEKLSEIELLSILGGPEQEDVGTAGQTIV